jgi:hypothetical protein
MRRYFCILFIFVLLGLQSCTNKNQNVDNNINTITQTEIAQEMSDNSENNINSENVSFRIEHPFLFTIIIVCSLLVVVLIVLIITSKISDTIRGTVSDSIGDILIGVGESIGDFFIGLFRK